MSEKDNIVHQQALTSNQSSGKEPPYDLIRQCIAQNRLAQKKLYDEYAPLLYSIIKRYTYNNGQADEILNDSFFKILTNLQSYSMKGSFEGWMRRIVINTITDHFRKYIKKEPAYKVEIETTDMHVEGEIMGRMGYKDLLGLIHQLPETQRTVFNLFVFEQLSHKEIGDHLGINENNSRWHLNDARRRLKEKINLM
ncbi:MAG TPA: sigma-70 family RNA polymerase sigma factor [Flavipsychrobacter sp.]|nr:sigma-70 family RNA polymerase sigma factor [Flavipsychrobacter sp.]